MIPPLVFFPTINACLNASSAVLLSLGYLCIRSKRILAHKICMLSAVGTTLVFLTCYLYYHLHAGTTRFPRHGWLRAFYFTILFTHTILAVTIVPMVILTLRRAFQGRFDKHAAIARWTLPLWFYVSVTGVLIYFLLYGVAGVTAVG